MLWSKRRKVDKLLILIPKKSIINISNQTRKWRVLIGLCLASGVIMILGIIALFLDFRLSKLLLSLAGENVWIALCFFGMVAAFAAMTCLCLMIKCPRCKLRWFWHAMAKDHKRNISVDHMSQCPRCNYPDDEKQDAGPTLVSQKPILEISKQKNKFRNLWRAFFAATAVMLLGVVGLVYFYRFFHLWRILFFVGFTLALIMLASLWISIRCPKCGLRWYWYAFSKDSKYLKIGNISHCPRCDFPG
jgi:hypothetical protein